MDPRLDTYDWEQAFTYATGFTREDVKSIAGMDEGENDEEPWIIYGKLKNGEWFYLTAGCDYTGWDCQAAGDSATDTTKGRIERFALTDQDRRRLGVVIPKVTKKKTKKVTKKKTTKKPSLTELVAKAKGEMAEHQDRKDRMEKLLQMIAALFKPSPLIFWFDQSRWDKFEDLRAAIEGDGWDDEIHPHLAAEVPQWQEFLHCLETLHENLAPLGEPYIEFADSVIVFDAVEFDRKDVVISVQGAAFVVKTYWEDGWEHTSREYGHPKTAEALLDLLKEMGCSLV